MAHARPGRDLFPQWQQRLIHEHDLIVGIVDDERELVGVKPEIQGVEDTAHQRDAEVRLEMLVVVPAERGHPIAGTDAETLQRAGQAPRAGGEIGVGVPVDRLVRPTRDDLAPRKDADSVTENRLQREREVHHQAVQHGADCRSRAACGQGAGRGALLARVWPVAQVARRQVGRAGETTLRSEPEPVLSRGFWS